MAAHSYIRLRATGWVVGLSLSFCGWPLAVVAQVPTQSTKVAPDGAGSGGGLDFITVTLLVFVVGLLYGLYQVYQRRLSILHQQEAMAAAAFEAEVFTAGGQDGVGALQAPLATASSAVLLQSETIPYRGSATIDGYGKHREDTGRVRASASGPESEGAHNKFINGEGPDRIDAKCGWILEALKQAGIYDDLESLETRHGQPKSAAVLRLKRGKSAILLPEMESLLGTSHLLARFDMVIVANPHGKAVIIKTLNQVIADQF